MAMNQTAQEPGKRATGIRYTETDIQTTFKQIQK
jgi:hypothetical protein